MPAPPAPVNTDGKPRQQRWLDFHGLDIAKKSGHVSAMKVKTADLKNNLSRYLRQVRERGETIIVCNGDQPIASLSPLAGTEAVNPLWKKECDELRGRFEKVGLTCRPPSAPMTGLPNIEPATAPDGRTDISTVQEMRKTRDW